MVERMVSLILGYGMISVILFKILHVHFPEDGQMEIGWKECFSAFLIAISVFAVSNISLSHGKLLHFPEGIHLR